MKKIGFSLLAILLIKNIALSQQKTDSVKIRKNELAINIFPFFASLTGNSNNDMPIGHVIYKRVIKNNWYMRAEFSAFGYNTSTNVMTINPSTNNKLNIKTSEYKHNNYLRGGLGIEKRWGKKERVKQFIGATIGYSKSSSDLSYYYAQRDDYSSNMNEFNNGTLQDSLYYNQKNSTNTFYLTPFYGAQFNFSNRCFFAAQAGIDIGQSFVKQTVIKDNSGANTQHPNFVTVDINLSLLSTNFTFGFKF